MPTGIRSTAKLSSRDICAIIDHAKKAGVSTLEVGGVKVEFSAKAAKPAASAHDAATPRQGARAKLAKVPAPAESAGQEAEQPEMSLATVADMETVAAVQEAQLMIDDPVAYEQQQIDAAMSETE